MITPYKIIGFNYVLSQVLKNAGSYSTLLVGIVVTTFYQVYAKEMEIEQEDMIKISELGYYTLAFERNADDYEEEYIEKYRKISAIIKVELSKVIKRQFATRV